jgi:5-methylcytosine-specific restriction endonuclease McrA
MRICERDGWKCWLCEGPIERNLVAPHSFAGTVDHVVPLSRGGTEADDNLRAAHYGCNSRRCAGSPRRAANPRALLLYRMLRLCRAELKRRTRKPAQVKKRPQPRLCPTCCKTFTPTMSHQISCSARCSYLRDIAKMRARTAQRKQAVACVRCGKAKLSGDPRTKFCGRVCKRALGRKRYKQRKRREGVPIAA